MSPPLVMVSMRAHQTAAKLSHQAANMSNSLQHRNLLAHYNSHAEGMGTAVFVSRPRPQECRFATLWQ